MTSEIRSGNRRTEPVGLRSAINFEWIKIRSIRAPWVALLIGAILMISGAAGAGDPQGPELGATMSTIYDMFDFAAIAICMFGVLAATTEYMAGTIRASFLAVPRRSRLLTAKALVVFTLTTTVGLSISLATYLVGAHLLPDKVTHPSLGDPTVLRIVLGGGIYLGILGTLALSLGLLLKSSLAGGMTTITICFIAPGVLHQLVGPDLAGLWPTKAGEKVMQVFTEGPFGPISGLIWFATISLAVLAVTFTIVKRRDV